MEGVLSKGVLSEGVLSKGFLSGGGFVRGYIIISDWSREINLNEGSLAI